MPSNPTAAALHIDRALTDFAIAYGPELSTSFVADRACTVKDVDKESDYYYVWNKGDFFRSEAAKRADGDKSEGGGQRVSSTTYFADVYALHTLLTDRQRAAARNEIDVEAAKVRYLMHQMKLIRDKQFASELFATSVWSGFTDQKGVASGASTNEYDQWDDYTNSDPIANITTQISNLEVTAGMPGVELVAVTNTKVFRTLQNHPDFLDRIKYTAGVERPASVTATAMAEVLGIDEIIIAKSVENTAAEGATATMAKVFDDYFLLLYRATTASDDMPTAATLFSHSEFDDVTPDGAAIFSWYEEARRATIMEAQTAFDIKVTAADMGGLFYDCIA
jgi:hypothetical protein